MLSPKEQFQKTLQPHSSFRNVIRSDDIQNALGFALSAYAQTSPTQEQLGGVNKFIDILVNIGEPIRTASNFPNKSLDSSVMNPPEPPANKK